jgi:hypothetical protein
VGVVEVPGKCGFAHAMGTADRDSHCSNVP